MEASTRYLVERRFRVPLLMARYRELEGEPSREVVGRLHVQPADAEVPLPVPKAADLREAAFFSNGGEPPDPLAQELTQLASQGWSFRGVTGGALAQVGLYGAYNALTDPEVGVSELTARRGAATVPLEDAGEAGAPRQ